MSAAGGLTDVAEEAAASGHVSSVEPAGGSPATRASGAAEDLKAIANARITAAHATLSVHLSTATARAPSPSRPHSGAPASAESTPELPEFVAGGNVTGLARLTLAAPLALRSLDVSLRGWEHAYFAPPDSAASALADVFSQALVVVDTRASLVAAPTSGNPASPLELRAGTHEWPFSLALPDTAPPDFVSRFGSEIAYSVHARAEVEARAVASPGAAAPATSPAAKVPVVACHPLEALQALAVRALPVSARVARARSKAPKAATIEVDAAAAAAAAAASSASATTDAGPIDAEASKRFLFDSADGKLVLHLRVPHAAYHLGDAIDGVELRVRNKSRRHVRRLRASLWQVETVRPDGREFVQRVELPGSAATARVDAAPGGEVSCVLRVPVPLNVCASIHTARLIEVRHVLRVTADVPWALGLHLEVPIELLEPEPITPTTPLAHRPAPTEDVIAQSKL